MFLPPYGTAFGWPLFSASGWPNSKQIPMADWPADGTSCAPVISWALLVVVVEYVLAGW